jgi:hypothetical protein
MPNTDQPAGPPAVADKTVTFDPAAAGWEPYLDEGFIGLVGPFWMRQSGDSYLYAFMAEPKHHNRRGIVQGGMLMTFADRSMGMTCWYGDVHLATAFTPSQIVAIHLQPPTYRLPAN